MAEEDPQGCVCGAHGMVGPVPVQMPAGVWVCAQCHELLTRDDVMSWMIGVLGEVLCQLKRLQEAQAQ